MTAVRPAVRGINYDTGTAYVAGWHSRPDWSPSVVAEEIGVIADELHCNAVNVYGSDLDRMLLAAEVAIAAGLQVWLQPRQIDMNAAETADHVGRVAEATETFRRSGAAVRLSVGCELTVFAAGIIPGAGFAQRARRLAWMWPLLPLFNWRLNRLLGRLVAVARDRFGGEITYGAGTWESVRWDPFDAVGLNHYRDTANASSYPDALRRARRDGKPLFVTEFGCCSYPGAAERGADGDGIVDWSDPDRPRIRGEHQRDEEVQARYIAELFDVFAEEGVDGTFVFEFSEPTYPRHDDARFDLDMASFGLVAVRREPGPTGDVYTRAPKAAFHEVARRHARDR